MAGYLHPYDLDTAQERFMHSELGDNRLYRVACGLQIAVVLLVTFVPWVSLALVR